MKVVLLASDRITLGFLLGGIHEGYSCNKPGEAKKAFHACLKRSDVGVILMSKDVADMMPEEVRAARNASKIIPMVSVLPEIQQKVDG